jgi:CubicO group peptidase (beta-lactamase class C family)
MSCTSTPSARRPSATTRSCRRDAIFRIASLTKPITAAATLSLVDEGLLRLEQPVDELLPELANRRVLRTLDAELDDTVPPIGRSRSRICSASGSASDR